MLKVVEANENNSNSHIVIVGSGTEYSRMDSWFKSHIPKNATLLAGLPKDKYDRLNRAANVGLIFLDPRFTIPNYPSRLLSYLENGMPVLLATDTATDMGRIAEKEGFGKWSKSGDLESFMHNMDLLSSNPVLIEEMGKRGLQFLLDNYTVDKVTDIICKSLN